MPSINWFTNIIISCYLFFTNLKGVREVVINLNNFNTNFNFDHYSLKKDSEAVGFRFMWVIFNFDRYFMK